MRNSKSNQEVEIKLPVPDARALRRLLKRLRAKEIVPRTYELNTLYDTRSRGLMRRGQLMRLRIEQPASRGRHRSPGTTVLTYKGPSQSSGSSPTASGKPARGSRFKIRREAEVSVSHGKEMVEILRALALRPVFRYQKFRTTYALPGTPKLKIEFDETPVGLFLEMEGSASAIDRAAKLLGYTQSDYITETYADLYIADCLRRRIRPSNMLFPPSKKLPSSALFP